MCPPVGNSDMLSGDGRCSMPFAFNEVLHRNTARERNDHKPASINSSNQEANYNRKANKGQTTTGKSLHSLFYNYNFFIKWLMETAIHLLPSHA